MHVSQRGDAVDLAGVGVVGQVDELVSLPSTIDVEDHPPHVPRLGVREAAPQIADGHRDVVVLRGVGREHDLVHRHVAVPQREREETDVLAAGDEAVHEVDPHGGRPAVDGQPAVARADAAAADCVKRGEGERALRRQEQGGHVRLVPIVWNAGWSHRDGDERWDRRRERGAPRGADAPGAAVGF